MLKTKGRLKIMMKKDRKSNWSNHQNSCRNESVIFM